jgi:cytosine deaminase
MLGPPRAQACRIGHLDRPYADWPAVVTRVPADAMRLPAHGRIAVGGPANLVLLRARAYSEALARPQTDRARLAPCQGDEFKEESV